MLNQNDLQQIGTLLGGTEKKLVTLVEGTEKKLVTLIEGTEKKLVTLIEKTKEELMVGMGELLERQVLPQFDNLPDKNYLDDKLADLKGDLVVTIKKLNEKQDFTIEKQREHGTLTQEDVVQIQQKFQIFPSS